MNEMLKKKHKKGYALPGPNDLSLDTVQEFYKSLKPGDRITFPSIGACFTKTQLMRKNQLMVVEGTLVKAYPFHALVRLPGGTLESTNYFDILKVNGKPHSGYVRRGDIYSEVVLADGTVVAKSADISGW
jgi:hypothetical protein